MGSPPLPFPSSSGNIPECFQPLALIPTVSQVKTLTVGDFHNYLLGILRTRLFGSTWGFGCLEAVYRKVVTLYRGKVLEILQGVGEERPSLSGRSYS